MKLIMKELVSLAKSRLLELDDKYHNGGGLQLKKPIEKFEEVWKEILAKCDQQLLEVYQKS